MAVKLHIIDQKEYIFSKEIFVKRHAVLVPSCNCSDTSFLSRVYYVHAYGKTCVEIFFKIKILKYL